MLHIPRKWEKYLAPQCSVAHMFRWRDATYSFQVSVNCARSSAQDILNSKAEPERKCAAKARKVKITCGVSFI